MAVVALHCSKAVQMHYCFVVMNDDDEIAYFTVRWETRASFVYRTKNMK